MNYEPWVSGTGQRLQVHSRDECRGNCPIHNPTRHHMIDWPTHWREDRNIMERICPCGVGHPDPDCQGASRDGVHGCCGCCNANPNPAQPSGE